MGFYVRRRKEKRESHAKRPGECPGVRLRHQHSLTPPIEWKVYLRRPELRGHVGLARTGVSPALYEVTSSHIAGELVSTTSDTDRAEYGDHPRNDSARASNTPMSRMTVAVQNRPAAQAVHGKRLWSGYRCRNFVMGRWAKGEAPP